MPGPLDPTADVPAKRISLEREVRIHVPRFDAFLTEYSGNLSTSGMFIVSDDPLVAGTVFDLEFSAADGWKMIRGRAQVVWNRHIAEGPDRPAGMGVRFIELDSQSRRLVQWVVQQHLVEGGKSFELDELRTVVDESLSHLAAPEAAGAETAGGEPAPPGPRPFATTAASVSAPAPTPFRDPLAGGASARPRRRPLPWLLAAAALAVAVGGLGALVLRWPQPAPSEPLSAGDPVAAAPATAPAPPPAAAPAPPPAAAPAPPSATAPAPLPPAAAAALADAAATSPPRPPPPAPPLAEVGETVESWADAWSSQSPERYLSFYARAFEPPPGLTRAAWEEQRRQRLTAPKFISVSLAGVEVERLAPDRARARFAQTYRSDRLDDTVDKTLELVWEDGAWKIARETSR